jgi:hypothetical protein
LSGRRCGSETRGQRPLKIREDLSLTCSVLRNTPEPQLELETIRKKRYFLSDIGL